MRFTWTAEKVKQFTDWQHSVIFGPEIKLKHRLNSKFLIFLWQDHQYGDGNICRFFLSELYRADSNNISLYIADTKYLVLSGDFKCQGYFDSAPRVLACATGGISRRRNWLMTLVHETCHMDQFLEDRDLWETYEKIVNIDDWLSGKKFTKRSVDHAIDTTQMLELDCEIRATKKIKKFNLPINLDEYIQKANAYLFFHQYMKESRHWPVPPASPYGDKIWPRMPKRFLSSRDKYLLLSEEHRQLYKRYS